MYCIIDVETTGGHPDRSKITEIAIYKFDGTHIVDQLVTLLNPECHIPDFISRLTGISNDMVVDSPKFYEVAARVIDITQDAVFIAHNVAFDYSCIRSEFASLGYVFNRPVICTVRLARVLMPGYRSYSLGNLCNDLGISINGRHRAGGDALATVELFKMLLNRNHGVISIDNPYHHFDHSLYHPHFDWKLLPQMPEKPGLYYFRDENGDILYIGHGKNIRNQVLDHLSKAKSHRSRKLLATIASVDFELTGTSLIAAMKASIEIGLSEPRYNQSDRLTRKPFGLFTYTDQRGFVRLKTGKVQRNSEVLAGFQTQEEANQALYAWVDEYGLCQKLCGLYEGNSGCFQYHLNQCKGACVGLEAPESYNQRVNRLIQELDLKYTHRVIIDKGRRDDEYSVVYIGQSNEIGWGYLSADEAVNHPDEFRYLVKLVPDTQRVKATIKSYFSGKPHPIKIIDLKG
jgi:DNA polymerase-3 subunit epsilon